MRQQQQLLLPWQMAVFCLALRRRTQVAPPLLGEPSPPSCTTVLLLCFIDSSLFSHAWHQQWCLCRQFGTHITACHSTHLAWLISRSQRWPGKCCMLPGPASTMTASLRLPLIAPHPIPSHLQLPSAVRPTAGGFTRSNSQASLRERADYVTAAFRHQQQPQQQQQQQQQVQHQQHNGAHEGSGGTARHHNHRRHGYHAHSRERHSGSVGASGGVRRPASASATRVQPASVRFSRRRSHAAAPSPSASSSTGNPSGGGHRRHHGLHGHSNRHDRAGGGSAGGSGLLAGGPGGGGGGGPGGDNMSLRGHRTRLV